MEAVVIKVERLRPHPNPEVERLQLLVIGGLEVVVSKDVKIGDWGVYFPAGAQLSEEFCRENSLYNDPTKNKNTEKRGYFDSNRRVTVQRFKGHRSEGFFVEFSHFDYCGHPKKVDGFEFDSVNGHKILSKYLTKKTLAQAKNTRPPLPWYKKIGNKILNLVVPNKKNQVRNFFREHKDTKHVWSRIGTIGLFDFLVITEKLHGTSHRIGLLPEKATSLVDRIADVFGMRAKPRYRLYTGSRRVVLQASQEINPEKMRDKVYQIFKQKNLNPGETIFFEIVGWENADTPIMNTPETKELGKSFKQKYGDKMVFSYGAKQGEFEIYIYRITNLDHMGNEVDLPWKDIVARVDELNSDDAYVSGKKYKLNLPPLFRVTSLDELVRQSGQEIKEPVERARAGRDLLATLVDELSTGESVVDSRHIKEGVCVRIESTNLVTLKHKSYEFKILEGIEKAADLPDTEEFS